MEGHFAQDAGEMPAKFAVATEAAKMEHDAIEPGKLFFDLKSCAVRFHVRSFSFDWFFFDFGFYTPMRNCLSKRLTGERR